MANGENRVISHIRSQMKSAHWLLEETITDVSDEMVRFAPPGKALPIGAAYVHYVSGEDWTIHDCRRCEHKGLTFGDVLRSLDAGQSLVEVDDEESTVRVWVE